MQGVVDETRGGVGVGRGRTFETGRKGMVDSGSDSDCDEGGVGSRWIG